MARPNYWEEEGSRKLTFNRRGAFGERKWMALYEQRFAAAPLLGDPYPGGGSYDAIACTEVTFEPCGKTGDGHAISIPDGLGGTTTDNQDYSHCRVTAHYEYEFEAGNIIQVNSDCAADIVNVVQGRSWVAGGKPVEDPIPAIVNIITVVRRFYSDSLPLVDTLQKTNMVNSDVWMGGAAGTWMFEGATWESDYDPRRNVWRYLVEYRFKYRAIPWNMFYRPARQKQDDKGSPMVDSTGYPIYETGIMGTSAWDYVTPPVYGSTAFAGAFL